MCRINCAQPSRWCNPCHLDGQRIPDPSQQTQHADEGGQLLLSKGDLMWSIGDLVTSYIPTCLTYLHSTYLPTFLPTNLCHPEGQSYTPIMVAKGWSQVSQVSSLKLKINSFLFPPRTDPTVSTSQYNQPVRD